MRREDLVDLNALLAIAEEGSFTRAAARLGTSQSSLSHVIRRLETRLGVRLLTRTTRSVAPTAAGERLMATLRPALASIEAELGSLGELREKPAGAIRITTSEHAATTVFDAGVRLGEALAKDMVAVRIGPDLRMAVAGSPDYFRERSIPRAPQDLAEHACVNMRLSSSGGLYVWEFERDGRELHVRVDGQFAFNNINMIVRAAEAGFGLCFVMEDQIARQLADGRLVRVLDDWCQPFSGYYLYYPSRRQPSAAFALLVDALRYRG